MNTDDELIRNLDPTITRTPAKSFSFSSLLFPWGIHFFLDRFLNWSCRYQLLSWSRGRSWYVTGMIMSFSSFHHLLWTFPKFEALQVHRWWKVFRRRDDRRVNFFGADFFFPADLSSLLPKENSGRLSFSFCNAGRMLFSLASFSFPLKIYSLAGLSYFISSVARQE